MDTFQILKSWLISADFTDTEEEEFRLSFLDPNGRSARLNWSESGRFGILTVFEENAEILSIRFTNDGICVTNSGIQFSDTVGLARQGLNVLMEIRMKCPSLESNGLRIFWVQAKTDLGLRIPA